LEQTKLCNLESNYLYFGFLPPYMKALRGGKIKDKTMHVRFKRWIIIIQSIQCTTNVWQTIQRETIL